jgi:hypothetical protein
MRAALLLALLAAAPALAIKPQIYVDSVNGASPASGAPEAIGPISALATCHTNGLASTTIHWPANGLSGAGVLTDGSALLFLATASGRQFSVITGLAAGTVTVADSFNIAAASAVDCGVGGRLLNVTPQLLTDFQVGALTGWQVLLVSSGVNYTWTAARSMSAACVGCGIFGVLNGGVRPIVDCTFTGGICLSAGGGNVSGVEFRNTNANKAGTVGINQNDGSLVDNCIIGGTTAATAFAIGIDGANTTRRTTVGNLIRNNVQGMNANGTDFTWFVAGNVFEGNTTGLVTDGATQNGFDVFQNIFWANGVGLELGNNDYNYVNAVWFNTFDSNTTAAVNITDAGGIHSLLFASNLLTSNTVGVAYSGAARTIQREAGAIISNCYGLGGAANGSDLSGFVYGEDVINVNPQYVDATTGDFTPTSQDAAFIAWPPGLDGLTPKFFPGTITESQPRCGAIQPAGSGGGTNVAF